MPEMPCPMALDGVSAASAARPGGGMVPAVQPSRRRAFYALYSASWRVSQAVLVMSGSSCADGKNGHHKR